MYACLVYGELSRLAKAVYISCLRTHNNVKGDHLCFTKPVVKFVTSIQ